jgi:hypothetical protein
MHSRSSLPDGGRLQAPEQPTVAGLLIVLFLHDLSEARSRKAFDRIFKEGRRRR